jgi:hypothetical protein
LLANDLQVKQEPFVGIGGSSGKAVFVAIGDKEVLIPILGNPTAIYHSEDNRVFAMNFDALSNYRSFGIVVEIGRKVLIYPDVGPFAESLLAAKKLIRDTNFKSEDFSVEGVDGNNLKCYFRGLRPGVEEPEECRFSLPVEADEFRLSVRLLD